MKRLSKRTMVISAFAVLLVTAVVWAATEVTVTKTSSKFANAFEFVAGDYYKVAILNELDDGYYLTYYIYDFSVPGFVERGSGVIDSSDVTWTSSGLTLNTNTEDIAIIGDGGDLELEWSYAPDGANEISSKTTQEYLNIKQIIFDERETSSAVAEGSFLGDDFSGTGTIQIRKGKVILQVK